MTQRTPEEVLFLAEFLVEIAIDVPAETDEDVLAQLIIGERERGRELAAAGHLMKLWRTPGHWGNWGVWRATDRAGLIDLLKTLPLYPYMTTTVHDLAPHSSDPAATDLEEQPNA